VTDGETELRWLKRAKAVAAVARNKTENTTHQTALQLQVNATKTRNIIRL